MLLEHHVLVAWLDSSWRADLKGHPDDSQAVDCHRLVSGTTAASWRKNPATKPRTCVLSQHCHGIKVAPSMSSWTIQNSFFGRRAVYG